MLSRLREGKEDFDAAENEIMQLTLLEPKDNLVKAVSGDSDSVLQVG